MFVINLISQTKESFIKGKRLKFCGTIHNIKANLDHQFRLPSLSDRRVIQTEIGKTSMAKLDWHRDLM